MISLRAFLFAAAVLGLGVDPWAKHVSVPGPQDLRGVVVDSVDGLRPIRRAVVTVSSVDVTFSLQTVTDQDGRFSFKTLPTGRYSVQVEKSGFLTNWYGSPRSGRGPGRLVEIGDSKEAEISLDLTSAGMISGTVTGGSRRPLSEIIVHLTKYRVSTEKGGRPFVVPFRTVATDDRGFFRFDDLAPGNYVVTAISKNVIRVRDWSMTALDRVFAAASSSEEPKGVQWPATGAVGYSSETYPGGHAMPTTSVVRLAPGESRQFLDIELKPTRVFAVRGILECDDGPARGAQLRIAREGDEIDDLPGAISISTGGDGQFDVELPAGEYSVAAHSTEKPLRTGAGCGSHEDWGASHFSVAAQDLLDVRVPLRSGAEVTGRLIGSSSAAGSQLVLELVPLPLAGSVAFVVRPAVLEPGGEFVFPSVPPGRYVLRVQNGQSAGIQTRRITQEGRDVIDEGIEVRSERVSGLAIELAEKPSRVFGRVLNADLLRERDYGVLVFSTHETDWGPLSRRISEFAKVRGDGTYEVKGLPAGEYWVALADDLQPFERFDRSLLLALAKAAVRVALSDGAEVRQDILPTLRTSDFSRF